MKKFIIFSFSVSLILLLSSSAFGQTTGPARVYKVTLTKLELFNGTAWITVLDGASTTIDIASASAGAAAGNFVSDATIPDGTYTKVRVTVSASFTISGNVGTDYTRSTRSGSPPGCDTGTVDQEEECTVSVPGGTSAEEHTFPTPVTSTNGVASHKVRVSFDVANGIQNVSGQLYPNAPDITLSVIPL